MTRIESGLEVSINPQSDKTRQELVRGIVKDVLTRDQSHPHGVKVVLTSGDIGRVKVIHPRKATSEDTPLDPVSESSVDELIAGGENHFVEFKSSALWSKFYTKQQISDSKSNDVKLNGQRTSYFIIAKSIAGFANADGGNLLIGVKEVEDKDTVEVIGIESELKKIHDSTIDGYRRMIIDDIVVRFLPNFFLHQINNYLRIQFPKVSEQTVCHLQILRSDKPIFTKSKKDQLFVRIEASTREVKGEDMVNYCAARFGSLD